MADTPHELAALLGPFWSATRTRKALDIPSTTDLDKPANEGGLLGLTSSDGTRFYPVFQFQRTGEIVEVRPALRAVLRTLKDFDPWTVATFLHTPAPELDNRTPLDWATSDSATTELTELAKVVAREWAAGTT